jgi:hypothetical protein
VSTDLGLLLQKGDGLFENGLEIEGMIAITVHAFQRRFCDSKIHQSSPQPQVMRDHHCTARELPE